METVHSLSDLAKTRPKICLAMGVFDGVHLGHQAVISAAEKLALKTGSQLGVLTFAPHPIQVLAPEKAPRRILASLEHKQSLLERHRVEVLVIKEFTREFAAESARGFIQSITASCDLQGVAVGEDWKFGRGREGDDSFLKKMGTELRFEVACVSPVMQGGERISSTRIRQAIRDGNLESIKAMLGRPYTVAGLVVEGRKIGRTIGFPTANIDPRTEQLPPKGVWAVRVYLGGRELKGVANLGSRPTVEDEKAQRKLEVHIFDFHEDIYEAEVEVEFVSYIREEKKFDGLEALKTQIVKDIKTASEMLSG